MAVFSDGRPGAGQGYARECVNEEERESQQTGKATTPAAVEAAIHWWIKSLICRPEEIVCNLMDKSTIAVALFFFRHRKKCTTTDAQPTNHDLFIIYIPQWWGQNSQFSHHRSSSECVLSFEVPPLLPWLVTLRVRHSFESNFYGWCEISALDSRGFSWSWYFVSNDELFVLRAFSVFVLFGNWFFSGNFGIINGFYNKTSKLITLLLLYFWIYKTNNVMTCFLINN